MEPALTTKLCSAGVTEGTLGILQEEGVVSWAVFTSLREEHFGKLLPRLKVGQHAILLKLWDQADANPASHESLCKKSVTYSSYVSKASSPGSSSLSSGLSSPLLSPPGCLSSPPSQLPAHSHTQLLKENVGATPSVKELSQLYKQRSLERLGLGTRKGKDKDATKTMLVTLGGMIYDPELNKGIRKKYLPEPNPRKVELPLEASLTTVFEKAKQLYFEELQPEDYGDSLSLADSSGILIPVDDMKKWSLGSFYQKNSLQPSRYKLYVALTEQNSSVSKGSQLEAKNDDGQQSGLAHTECILKTCVECDHVFRTYVPDTVCHLPDGGLVCYKDPQLKCPACDEQGFGAFMNEDLFPELGLFQPNLSPDSDP